MLWLWKHLTACVEGPPYEWSVGCMAGRLGISGQQQLKINRLHCLSGGVIQRRRRRGVTHLDGEEGRKEGSVVTHFILARLGATG